MSRVRVLGLLATLAFAYTLFEGDAQAFGRRGGRRGGCGGGGGGCYSDCGGGGCGGGNYGGCGGYSRGCGTAYGGCGSCGMGGCGSYSGGGGCYGGMMMAGCGGCVGMPTMQATPMQAMPMPGGAPGQGEQIAKPKDKSN